MGAERAHVQHQGFQDAPRLRGAWCSKQQKLADGKSNKGRIQAYDGPIYIADAALYLMSKKPDLGIKDPYELNEQQYAAALDVLRKQHPLVHRYWHDANVQVQDFTNEGVVASSSWPFQVNTLQGERSADREHGPSRGRHRMGGHHDAARTGEESELRVQVARVVDHAESAGRRRRVVRFAPRRARRLQGNALLGEDGCKKNGFDNFDKIRFWRTPEAKCATHGDACVPYSRWSTDYVAVMGGR